MIYYQLKGRSTNILSQFKFDLSEFLKAFSIPQSILKIDNDNF